MVELLFRERQSPHKLQELWDITLVTGANSLLNQKILRILEANYQFPVSNGPPLGTFFTNLRGNGYTVLSTSTRTEKRVEDSTFDVPQGLKKVASVEMAITGSGVGDMMKDLMLTN